MIFGTCWNKLTALIKAALFFFALILSLFSHAHANSDISLTDPWVRMMPPTSRHSAAYVVIHNNNSKDDVLLSVHSSDAESVSVHQTKNVNGMMQMLSADNMEIPAKTSVKFAPGGFHIMLMGLHQPLTETADITINFNFQRAGKVSIVFPTLKK